MLRTADDALGLRAFAQRHGAQRAVVAGGGLLGLEAAYALHKLGLRTAVLERGDRLLRRQLDARASALLQTYLEGLGLEILTRRRDGRARRATGASTWRCWPTTARSRSTCSSPRPASRRTPTLAKSAGLAVNRGVLVDERMRTMDYNILAAGDVAEHAGRVHGLWPVAVEQAEVAADNAVGGEQGVQGLDPVHDAQGRRRRADVGRPLRGAGRATR